MPEKRAFFANEMLCPKCWPAFFRAIPADRSLVIRFEQLIRDGVVADQAELARLGHVTRARLTQIMNLLNLAPDIQEPILHLPRVEGGPDPVFERQLRPVAAVLDWRKQRRMWRLLVNRRCAQTGPRLADP